MDTTKIEGLVEGRSCGTCTVCCYALPIDTPEIQKLPGALCVNCTGRGCGIYDRRPTTCREFHCGWWLLPQLDDDWRPDKSGVLITPENNDIPREFEVGSGIEFLIVGGEAAIRRRPFLEFISLCVRRRIPTFVSVPGPEGFFPAKVLVNANLTPAAVKNDIASVLTLMLSLLKQAESHEFRRAVLEERDRSDKPLTLSGG